MDERPTILPDGDWVWPGTDQPREGGYDAWTKPAGPTELTLEMPIPDYARPPGDLAGVLRDHFGGVKQEFSAKLGQGIRRQLDEVDLFDHDPNNPLQRGTFKLTDHEKMLDAMRASANEDIQDYVHQQYLAANANTVVMPVYQHPDPQMDETQMIHPVNEYPKIEPEVLPGDHRTNYLQTALDRVREVVDGLHPLDPKPEYNLYVVWFCKTLQNWKALVGSTLADGMYYEVTYDGDKGRTYVDIYHKVDQSVIYDDPSC